MKKKVIYKYNLHSSRTMLELPKESVILCAQVQGGNTCVWVLINTEIKEIEERTFITVPTGGTFEHTEDMKYIDTVQLMSGALIYHIFEDIIE